MRSQAVLAVIAAFAMTGCASHLPDEMQVVGELWAPEAHPDIVLAEDVEVRPAHGYCKKLPSGSVWTAAGGCEQGQVYRPTSGTVLSVTGRHIHEAYLVVRDGKAVGFYFPVEGGFIATTEAVALPVRSR